MSSFNSILKNRKYIGEYKYQDVVIPGGVPSIVPQELFDRVQARMEKNKRAPAMSKADEKFLLTTKLFCGKCGRLMVGESGTSHTGKKHYYYKCGSAKRKTGCTKKAVKKDWIENLVVGRTMRMIFDDRTLAAIAEMVLEVQSRESTSLPVLKRQLAQAEQGIENMLNAIHFVHKAAVRGTGGRKRAVDSQYLTRGTEKATLDERTDFVFPKPLSCYRHQ